MQHGALLEHAAPFVAPWRTAGPIAEFFDRTGRPTVRVGHRKAQLPRKLLAITGRADGFVLAGSHQPFELVSALIARILVNGHRRRVLADQATFRPEVASPPVGSIRGSPQAIVVMIRQGWPSLRVDFKRGAASRLHRVDGRRD